MVSRQRGPFKETDQFVLSQGMLGRVLKITENILAEPRPSQRVPRRSDEPVAVHVRESLHGDIGKDDEREEAPSLGMGGVGGDDLQLFVECSAES